MGHISRKYGKKITQSFFQPSNRLVHTADFLYNKEITNVSG